jgi:hypothetical protein
MSAAECEGTTLLEAARKAHNEWRDRAGEMCRQRSVAGASHEGCEWCRYMADSWKRLVHAADSRFAHADVMHALYLARYEGRKT